MPRVWGPWSATSSTQARYRVAVDYTISGTTIDYTYYFESAFSIYKNVTLTRTGAVSGVYTPRVDTAGGVVALGYGGSISGARGSSVTIGGRVTNILHGLTCSVSVSIPIPALAPSKPATPTVSNIAATTVRGNLASAPAANGASINAYGWQIENGPSATLTTGGRTWNVTGLTRATSYRMRVRARNSVGWGTWSNWRNFTTLATVPNAVGTPSASASGVNVSVSWSAPNNGGSAITGYDMQRATNSSFSGATTQSVSGTSASFTGVRGTTYWVRVRAKNARGNGAWSGSRQVTVPAIAPTTPAAPVIDNVTQTGARARLTSAPPNNGAAITRYEWQVSSSGPSGNTSGLSWTFTGIPSNATRQVRVRAVNSAGTSGWSPWSATFTTNAAAPNAPTNVNASLVLSGGNVSRVELTWSRNTSTTGPNTGQRIQRRDNVNTSWVTISTPGATATSASDTSAVNHRNYEYRVVSVNAAGTATSSAVSIATPPNAPTISATRVGNDIRINVTAPSNMYPQINTLVIQDSPGGGAWTQVHSGAPSTSVLLTAPNPSITHRYRAYYRVGSQSLNGAYSNLSATIQLESRPAAPTPISPTGSIIRQGTPITLEWRHNPTDSSQQRQAEVSWRLPGESTFTAQLITGAANTYTIPGSQNWDPTVSGAVEWRVRTWGSHQTTSPWSAVSQFTINAPPLATITAPLFTYDRSILAVSWTYYDLEGTSNSGSEYQLLQDGTVIEQGTTAAGVLTRSFTTRVRNDETYTVRIRVRDGAGLWSSWAASTFDVTFSVPAEPTITAEYNPNRGSAIIQIDNPTILNSYEWEGVPGQSASIKKSSARVAYQWTGVPHSSTSVKLVETENGMETVSVNYVQHPSFESSNFGWVWEGVYGGTGSVTSEPLAAMRERFEGLSSGIRYGLLRAQNDQVDFWYGDSSPMPIQNTYAGLQFSAFSLDDDGGEMFVYLVNGAFSSGDNNLGSLEVSGNAIELIYKEVGVWEPPMYYTFSAEIPSSWESLKIGISLNPGSDRVDLLLDAVMLVQGSTEESVLSQMDQGGGSIEKYFDGSTPDITDGQIVARNLVPNPSFEYGLENWSTSSTVGTYRRTQAYPLMWHEEVGGEGLPGSGRAGNWIGEWESSGTGSNPYIMLTPASNYIPIQPGEFIAVSALMANASDSPILTVSLVVQFMSDTGQNLGSVGASDFQPARFYAGRKFVRVGQAPEGAVAARIVLWGRNSDTTSPSAGSRYWADAVHADVAKSEAEALSRISHYFDGDTQTQIPAVSNDLYRSIDGGLSWTRIATEIPLGGSWEDVYAPAEGRVLYRAYAVSDIPSETPSNIAELNLVNATRPCPPDGIPVMSAYLGFHERVCRAFLDIDIEETLGMSEKVLTRFSGQDYPTQFSGKGQQQIVTLTFTAPAEEIRTGEYVSDYQEWVDMVRLPGPHFYRDFQGRRFPVSITPIDAIRNADDSMTITFELTRTRGEVDVIY